MRKLTNATAAKKIQDLSSAVIFSVTFIKRTTGEIREMTCRKGVKKYVNGSGSAYDPSDHNLVFVYDMQKAQEIDNSDLPFDEKEAAKAKCYRSINLEQIMRLKINGIEYVVNDIPVKDFSCSWVSGGVNHRTVIKARTPQEAQTILKRNQGWQRAPKGLQIDG